MTDKNKQLCLDLMRAETEEDLIAHLTEAGYWNEATAWRLLGDTENNFSTVGNQQGDPIAALVEKVVNSIDALLLGECRSRGIDPEGPDAPQTPLRAVAQFFEDRAPGEFNPAQDGQIAHWHDDRVQDVARRLTVTATGKKPPGNPSLSIADAGEGQTPDRFPDTLLSIGKSNKLRIPFVQGKFNMGGTGALQFCGTSHNFQLIVSRRNPDIVDATTSPRDSEWGFTILRRVDPEGAQRSSVYEYLAPGGSVLSFAAQEFGIFPRENDSSPYGRESTHGTLIKLYAYEFGGTRSTITRTGGLFRRIDATLPRAILPARYLDTRYAPRGTALDSRMNGFGLETLLRRRSEELLEASFPQEGPISVDGAHLDVSVYAFRSTGKSETGSDGGRRLADRYRARRNAVTFLINGQTHATHDTSFFATSRVGLDYLRQDLFVTVDCSSLPGRAREDLFMNSRDRMRNVPLRGRIVAALEEFLRDHPALKALNAARREKVGGDDGAEQVVRELVQQLLQDHPDLQKVLLGGSEISPIVDPPQPPPFVGKEFPTFFKLERPKVQDGIARVGAAQSSRLRLSFRTDAEDSYFTRLNDPGELSICDAESGNSLTARFSRTGPVSGACSVAARDLLTDYQVGDVVTLLVTISDNNPSLRPPFEHCVQVIVGDDTPSPPSPPQPPKPKLDLPRVTEVWRTGTPGWEDLHDEEFVFDHQTAVQIRRNSEGGSSTAFDLFINMDNAHLDRVRRRARNEDERRRLNSRWHQVLELLTLGLVADYNRVASQTHRNGRKAWADESPGQFVYEATRAVAPIIPVLSDVYVAQV